MSEFDYEKSIWGRGTASLDFKNPTSFRLSQGLSAIAGLKQGAKVLEIGCGVGRFIRAIKKLKPELDCYGCDISKNALEAAKQANDGVVYDLSGQKGTSYASGFFDAVLIFDVLEHVDDPDAMLAEINRIMKQGGVFYCHVPCEGDVLSMWHWIKKFIRQKGHELTRQYAGHINYFSRRSLFDLFRKNNFNITRARYSEHLLGQVLGIMTFWSLDRAVRKKKLAQVNNETYFAKEKRLPIVKFFKDIVNGWVYLESVLFCRIPSPNVHLVVIKK
ncbi:MAG: class I SAM-dependent methyltransferase [Patescibacteria group bacterium]